MTAWSTVQTGILQVHRVDQTLLPAQVDSFVGCSLHCALHPPAEFMIGVTDTKKQQSEQKFYIYSDVSHTHPTKVGSIFCTIDSDHESRATCDGDVGMGVPSFKRQCCKLILSSTLNSVAGHDDSST